MLLLKSLLLAATVQTVQPVAGVWVTDMQGDTLKDPQSSGLTWRHGELVHLGDNSAAPEMRNILLRINATSGQLNSAPVAITVAPALQQGCFADLLNSYPDFEALTWDRVDDTTLITVTEDSSFVSLSAECKAKYGQTNATDYPTLLVKISIDQALSKAEITAVRPVQFPASANVGNFPNDGIEGLALDDQGNLYLGLEQNQANAPMIFKVAYDKQFWQVDDYVKVVDSGLLLPVPDNKDHPINDLDFLPSPKAGHPGYLVAVARNDDQLWLLDLSQQQAPTVVPMAYYAPTLPDSACPAFEPIVQTAAEGVAVTPAGLALINDPWKKHYPDNILCADNAGHFTKYSPLLFKLQLNPLWFVKPTQLTTAR